MSNKELLKIYLDTYHSIDLLDLIQYDNSLIGTQEQLIDNFLYRKVEYKNSGYSQENPTSRNIYDSLLKKSKEVMDILEKYQSLKIESPEQLKRSVDIYDLIIKIGKDPEEEPTKLLQTYIDGSDNKADILKHIKELKAAKRARAEEERERRKAESRSYDGQYSEYSRNMKGVEKSIAEVRNIKFNKQDKQYVKLKELKSIFDPIIQKYSLNREPIYFHKESFDLDKDKPKLSAYQVSQAIDGKAFKVKTSNDLKKLKSLFEITLPIIVDQEYDQDSELYKSISDFNKIH